MAKIVIEIDGKVPSLKIDDKEIENLSYFDVSAWKTEENSDVFFSYTVREPKDGDFRSCTTFTYIPATASFNKGKATIDKKNPTMKDYRNM